jgi:hypothetical protein
LDHDPPTSSLLNTWANRHIPPHPVYWLRWGLANFFPRLALNLSPQNLHFLSSWGYRHELPHLAVKF